MVDEADTKLSWRSGFFQGIAASLVATALWAGGSGVVSYAWSRLNSAKTLSGFTLFLLLIGAYVMGLAAWLTIRWLPRREKPSSAALAFRIFLEDADPAADIPASRF